VNIHSNVKSDIPKFKLEFNMAQLTFKVVRYF